MPLWKVYHYLLSLFILLICAQSSRGIGEKVKGVLGGAAKLPCDVDEDKCGKTFSITWAKEISNDWNRVYFLDGGNTERGLRVLDFDDRAKYIANNGTAYLLISSLRLEDEGRYRCDVTYIVEPCPSLTFSSIVIQVRPTQPEISQNGVVLEGDIGPFNEGEEISLSCETKDGKPTADVLWLKNGEKVNSELSTTGNAYGSEDVVATIKLDLTREDSGAVMTCRVENEALDEPLETTVKIGLRLKPLSIDVSGPSEPALEGDTVKLACVVEGARPPAEITWYNISEMIQPESEPDVEEMEDDTFRTTSELEIVVTRYDNEVKYMCRGTNEVLKDSGEDPFMKSVFVEVKYPPIVTIEPVGGIIVNETKDAVLLCSFDANPPDVDDIVWYKDFEQLDVEDNENYTISFDQVPKLTIHNVHRDERGVYSCALRNSIGGANSTNAIEMSVLYPPVVKATVAPGTVNEGEESSVSLRCEIQKGNPQNVLGVRWYKDEKFLSETTDDLSWREITRNFTGNYSCSARNEAGWGEISEPDDLIVRYLPDEAVIESDDTVIKGESVVLFCIVEELGLPEATEFAWELDGVRIDDQDDGNYTIDEADFDSQGNYSCYAINEVGSGPEGYHYINVMAPPRFLIAPRKKGGAARDASGYNITCQVECDPICDIEWFKNEESIMDSDLYDITTRVLDEDDHLDRFSSVMSILRWNMSAWPGGMLDRERDTANYTCRSTDNEAGEGVEATLLFSVEYAPENIRVTQNEIIVEEGEFVEPINCSASSWPLSSYFWRLGDLLVSDTSILDLDDVNRTEAGTYVCVASNSRGQATIEVVVEVLHIPECALTRDEEEDEVVLTCEGNANPDNVNFTWTKDDAEIVDDIETENTRSVYKFSQMKVEYYGEYECVVRNVMGESEPCRLNVTVAIAPPWDPQTGEKKAFVIAAVVGGIAILFLLIIVVIIVRMKRRRSTDASTTRAPKPPEAVYQNVESAEPKENGLSEPESKPMYENMPFFGRNKGPFRPDINDDLLYADMYDDVKLGKVPDPRMKPPLPPKGIGKKPKEPPLPPKTRKKAPSGDII